MPLNDAAYEALLRLRRVAQDNFSDTPWVFTHTRPRCRGVQVKSVYGPWGKAVKDAGIEWCTPHCLRHTSITELVHSDGVDIPTASRLAGQNNLQTTQGYIHVVDDRLRDAVAKLPTIVTI